MRGIIYTSLFLLFFSSCEKKIDIKYNSIAPIPIIESFVWDEQGYVSITTTIDMNQVGAPEKIMDAVVEVTRGDGEKRSFTQLQDSLYWIDTGDNYVIIGDEYTLLVKIEDKEYISKSSVHPEPNVGEISFLYQELTQGIGGLSANVQIFDTQGEIDYYLYRLSIFGEEQAREIYGLYSDRGLENAPQILSISLGMVGIGPSNINDGDSVVIAIKEIDQDEYIFRESASGLSQTLQPISTFTGGALGWFNIWKSEAIRSKKLVYKDIILP